MKSEQAKCDKCGVCCKLFLINLNKEEYLSGKYLTVNQELGRVEGFELAQERGLNFLAQNPDGSCVYLNGKVCGIHTERPQVCREFFCKGTEPQFEGMRKIIQKNK